MANEASYFIKLASWLGKALGESRAGLTAFNTHELGIALPDSVVQSAPVTGVINQLMSVGESLEEAATELETQASGGDEIALIAALTAFSASLAEFFYTLRNLQSAVEGAITPATIPDAAERTEALAMVDELGRRLGDLFMANAITSKSPRLAAFLKILGLFDWRRVDADPSNLITRTYVVKQLHLENLKDLINDPVSHLQDTHGWGRNDFDPMPFFELYADFLDEETSFELGIDAGDPFLRHGSFTIRRTPGITPPGLELEWQDRFNFEITKRIALSDNWGLNITSELSLAGGASGQILPPASIVLIPPSGELSGQLRVVLDRNPERQPFDLVTGGGLITLNAQNTSIGIDVRITWDPGAGQAELTPVLIADIKEATLRLGSEDADGFIASLLAAAEIEGQFDIGLEWIPDEGLRVRASGGVEIAIPVHQSIGPISLDTLFIALRIREDGTLALESSAGLTGNLGPISATIERIGAQLDLLFVDDAEAKFGPFDLDLSFKPPNGVGLSIDAGVVKGGGYLYFDFEKEEYAGVLELDLSGIVSVKAIGLITTRLPDGSQGFSLLLIITAEFGSPIQLGFGFTLSGVGGLLGLNRTMRLEAIAQGIRDGGINSIMFPDNVVENAPRIISDLKNYFPVEEGTFLIGPMVMIGWGTPNLVTVSLGIIIEIPGNIAILGVLKVALPDEDAALIIIQVNFIGAIEFDKSRLWFFAAMFESRVLFITLEGEMGLLVGWGDDASFVVSVGGFHPAFNPPPLPFGAIARIAISILNESFARIRVEGYFAVTSNSVQFGASVEIFFGVDAFNIDGHLGFDALFRFSPFYFIITISASLSVKVFGVGLFSVRMRGSLEGPTPWHVEGTGSISLLFFDIDVDFSHTWGEEAETTLPPISVLPLLVGEYDKSENWMAVLPTNNQLLVSLRNLEQESADLILHPVGSLKVSQRAVPLGLMIDKVGNQKPSDANNFNVTASTTGIDVKGEIEESFAVGQYFDKSESELLSARSFEPMKGGIELSVTGEQYHAPLAVKRVVRYEKIIIDTNFKRFVSRFYTWFGSLFSLFLNGNAVSKSAISYKQQKQLKPFEEQVQVGKPLYTVAYNSDNTAYSEEAMSFSSQVQAQEYMNQQIAANGSLAKQLHVIPQVEMQSTV